MRPTPGANRPGCGEVRQCPRGRYYLYYAPRREHHHPPGHLAGRHQFHLPGGFHTAAPSGRKIFWGWSADGRNWSFDPQPLVSPAGDGQSDLSGPHLLSLNGTTYVVYHGGSDRMYLTEVGNSFDREVHLGVLHTPRTGAPDNGRSAAPAFGADGGVSYMFYEAGRRSSSTIAVARAR